jgi:hypothetical protein
MQQQNATGELEPFLALGSNSPLKMTETLFLFLTYGPASLFLFGS